MSTNLVALIFLLRNVDQVSQLVAGALAVYHLAPVMRALSRMSRGRQYGSALGGPMVHGVVHGSALILLGLLYFGKL